MNLPRAIGSLAWALVAIHCTPLPAALGQTTGEWPALSLERRVGGLIQPVHIAHAGDGSGRLFVVEQRGVIRVVKRGALSPTPFLNISARVACCEEQGLLSVAFPPRFAQTKVFYVYYIDPADQIIVARYAVGADPDMADPSSEEILLTIDHSDSARHSGGQLAFGPMDGYLYIGTGDGETVPERAQDPASYLGKLLRIDVAVDRAYRIPDDNPFRNAVGAHPELWALGLRNPWRFSFDRETGDLYIGDVGQSMFEEVDVQPATSAGGENYGWPIMEGGGCYARETCVQTGLTLPVATYSHDDGCAITGGMVSRSGTYPRMHGRYFFGDFCSGLLWALEREGGDRQPALVYSAASYSLTSFGESEGGAVYVTDYAQGAIALLADSVVRTSLLAVTGPNAPADGAAGADHSMVPMLQARVHAGTSEDLQVEGLTLSASGEGDDRRIGAVAVILDQNGNGTAEVDEPVLGRGTFPEDNGRAALVFSPPQTIAVDESQTYLIVYDLGSTGSVGITAGRSMTALGLGVWALAIIAGRRGVRARTVAAASLIMLLWVAAGCGNDGGGGVGSSHSETYRVAITAIAAHGVSSGTEATASGLPLAGRTLTRP